MLGPDEPRRSHDQVTHIHWTEESALIAKITRVSTAINTTRRASLNNGLAETENRRLATSYRPSEIATLVSLGLGRRLEPP